MFQNPANPAQFKSSEALRPSNPCALLVTVALVVSINRRSPHPDAPDGVLDPQRLLVKWVFPTLELAGVDGVAPPRNHNRDVERDRWYPWGGTQLGHHVRRRFAAEVRRTRQRGLTLNAHGLRFSGSVKSSAIKRAEKESPSALCDL